MNYLEKYSIATKDEAVNFLKNVIQAKAKIEKTLEYSSGQGAKSMTILDALAAIKELEIRFAADSSWDLKYWLGKGYSWCGEQFSSIQNLQGAYQLSDGALANHIPPSEKNNGEVIDRNDIAFDLGETFLKIGHESFIAQAVEYLSKIKENCPDYHPALPLLADAFIQNNRFMDAAEVAEDAINRLKRDPHWSKEVSDTKHLTNIMSTAYSKEAFQRRDAGETHGVVEVLRIAKQKGVLKPIDRSLLQKMERMEHTLTKDMKPLNEILLGKNVVLTVRRELKEKFPDITFDFEAIRQEIKRRLNIPDSDVPVDPQPKPQEPKMQESKPQENKPEPPAAANPASGPASAQAEAQRHENAPAAEDQPNAGENPAP